MKKSASLFFGACMAAVALFGAPGTASASGGAIGETECVTNYIHLDMGARQAGWGVMCYADRRVGVDVGYYEDNGNGYIFSYEEELGEYDVWSDFKQYSDLKKPIAMCVRVFEWVPINPQNPLDHDRVMIGERCFMPE